MRLLHQIIKMVLFKCLIKIYSTNWKGFKIVNSDNPSPTGQRTVIKGSDFVIKCKKCSPLKTARLFLCANSSQSALI